VQLPPPVKSLTNFGLQLRDARYKYAIEHNFPLQYRQILEDTNSHSDDEYDNTDKGYIIKTLPFRSEAANYFFRRLDLDMACAGQPVGGKALRTRVVPATSCSTLFPEAPKHLPLNFYNPKWFNSLEPSIKEAVTNTKQVAFLLGTERNKHEDLNDEEFNEAYFDELTGSYNLPNIGNDGDFN
jgi:hypothetical protein